MGGVKHTAGPWVADGTTIRGERTRECNDSDFIADTGLTVGGIALPSCEANARLIAAAPDLKAAAQNALEVFLTVSMYFGDGSLGRAEIDDCIGQIEAALAKATGETK